MSLANIMDIASTGMSAQLVRLNVTASNLANAGSMGKTEAETYKVKEPIFSSLFSDIVNDGFNGAGVEVTEVKNGSTPLQRRYQPGHPMANKEGFVFLTNVNPMQEMANMISASRSYQHNVQVANTAKQLLLKTLNLGR